MNLATAIQFEGWAAQASVSQETFTMLDTKETFVGILEPLSELVSQMELGTDIRESARLHVLRTDCPASLLGDSAISQRRLVQGPSGPMLPALTWKIVHRNDNDGDIEARFTVVSVTGKDQ